MSAVATVAPLIPKTTVSGWGGYGAQDVDVLSPRTRLDCREHLGRRSAPLIARGMGRSYGDSANSECVLQTLFLDHFIGLDEELGVLAVEAGVTLREILKLVVPKGWFLPVTPGTSYVTVGGAIASDLHGKNHHHAGTLGRHISSITMLLGTGEIVTTSPTVLPDLFHATCGGMGLTGVILAATIKLIPIQSSQIVQTSLKTRSLEETCEALEANAHYTYSVAWIDCLKTGKHLGRGVVMLGEHAQQGDRRFDCHEPWHLPMHAPASLLNRHSVQVFNALYYGNARDKARKSVPMIRYFYPLDSIGSWNKLYGKTGFLQYQFVLPNEQGVANLRRLLSMIADSGLGSFLAVLKQFGPANENLMSFPIAGFTLALDFKVSTEAIDLLKRLDEKLIHMGGRVYLTKDAVMSKKTFQMTYKRWEEFEEVRERYGAIGKFASAQSRRLGLS